MARAGEIVTFLDSRQASALILDTDSASGSLRMQFMRTSYSPFPLLRAR